MVHHALLSTLIFVNWVSKLLFTDLDFLPSKRILGRPGRPLPRLHLRFRSEELNCRRRRHG
jgi:hypothetical protein